MTRQFDPDPVCCGVCRREATGLAYVPPSRWKKETPFFWLCDDPACISLGKTVFQMTEKQLSAHEGFALHEAGQDAGAYLESIGKTDLADMTEIEWHCFLSTVLTSFGDKMRARLLNHVAPF